jgi:hypothetical protein
MRLAGGSEQYRVIVVQELCAVPLQGQRLARLEDLDPAALDQ